MKKNLIGLVAVLSLIPGAFSQPSEIPHLNRQPSCIQLIVNGSPFLMLAGELGNSSSSCAAYMRPIWSDLKKMHLNTVLVPAYWEMIEPKEGRFDFGLIDSMVNNARRYQLKVVFLWFGSWKNSMSCYAPYWVKKDPVRFPRARKQDGTPVEIITPFSENNCTADLKAYTAFLQHLKETDYDHTVIMIQVENEIGMIPEARDYSDPANKAFTSQVPAELMAWLNEHRDKLAPELADLWEKRGMKISGTWEDIFGKGLQTDEIFMAWYFAAYTGKIAAAGKKVYNLPVYVNAALIRPGYKPGQYPSAGPLPHLIDIWKAAAPSVDLYSPDIYFRNFTEWAEKYDVPGNQLFIPEVGNTQSMTQAFYAFGKHNAMGYSPFSVESVPNASDNQISKAYNLLEQLTPLIIANQGKGTMNGFLLDSASQSVKFQLGNYRFIVKHEYIWPYATKAEGETPRNGGMIIMLKPDEFVFAGSGVIVTFESALNDGTVAGIGSLDEVEYANGKWITSRRMNGDQSHQGRHMHLPGGDFTMQRAVLYTYR
jgi:beta-galactosidase GanA